MESCIFANAKSIQETDFRVSNFEEQSTRKTMKQKRYDWWENTNREKLTNNNEDKKGELEPGEQNKHADRDTQIRQKRKGKKEALL